MIRLRWIIVGCLVCTQLVASFLEDDYLILSNTPESFLAPGLVYQGIMPSSVRILYYHKNIYQSDLHYEITVKNTSPDPISVDLLKGLSGPNPDGLFVGHKATVSFLEKGMTNAYDRIHLLPGEVATLIRHPVKPDHVISGFLKIKSDAHPHVYLRIRIIDQMLSHMAGLDYEMGTQLYESNIVPSFLSSKLTFSATSPIRELSLGQFPYVKDIVDGTPLKGNYGVAYEFFVTLTNPTTETRDIVLLFSPVGGMARATLIIDDELVQTGLVDHRTDHRPTEIKRFRLTANETRRVTIYTMPQPGAYYPVNLILSTDHPTYKSMVLKERK